MQILGLLLLFTPFLPTTTPTRRGSHVPGATSHLSRHVFSKIKARAQLKDLPKVVFETKKNSPPVDYLGHQPRNQDKDKDRKQHHWNQLIQHIENRHRDSTRQLFKKIKTDLIQTIQTLVSLLLLLGFQNCASLSCYLRTRIFLRLGKENEENKKMISQQL